MVFFRQLAEIAGKYLKKGASVYVEGKITTRKWQDKEGTDRYTTEITGNEMKMLGGGRQDGDSGERTQQRIEPERKEPAKKSDPFDDEDIPF